METTAEANGPRDAAAATVDGRPSDADAYADAAPELIRFATALVGAGDAADVVSIAVTKALATPAWPTVENRRAYLFRAVFTTAQSHLRKRLLRRDREASTTTGPHWDLPNLHPEVRDAVRRLSVRQRGVVVLTYWLDLDPAAVADRLGISEGSVRRHLARARANLRKVLDA